jgi:hypothetical protein
MKLASVVCCLALLELETALLAFPANPGGDIGTEKWATVRGQIVFDGDKFPEAQIYTHRATNQKFVTPSRIVDEKTRGDKNVFVWITTDPNERGIRMPREKIHPDLLKKPIEPVEMSVSELQFSPGSLAVRAGQKLIFKNTSTEPMNFKYFGKLQNGNVLVPLHKEHVVNEVKAEAMPIIIDNSIHPWMKAYVRVFEHPYFAITDERGRFEIRLVPVGKVRLFLWHPESGFRDGAKGNRGDEIEVKSRGSDVGKISIKPFE